MSAVENLSGLFSLTAGAALSEYRGCKLSTISAVYWTAGDTSPNLIGRTNDTYSSGAQAGLTALIRGSKMRFVASAAVSAGGAVYPAANGKVSSTAASGTQIGVALEAASGDGAEFTVLITL